MVRAKKNAAESFSLHILNYSFNACFKFNKLTIHCMIKTVNIYDTVIYGYYPACFVDLSFRLKVSYLTFKHRDNIASA